MSWIVVSCRVVSCAVSCCDVPCLSSSYSIQFDAVAFFFRVNCLFLSFSVILLLYSFYSLCALISLLSSNLRIFLWFSIKISIEITKDYDTRETRLMDSIWSIISNEFESSMFSIVSFNFKTAVYMPCIGRVYIPDYLTLFSFFPSPNTT